MFCGEVCGKMFLFLGVGKEITRYTCNIHYGWINQDFAWWGQGAISQTFAKRVPLQYVWRLLIRTSGCQILGHGQCWVERVLMMRHWTFLSAEVGRCKGRFSFITLWRAPPTGCGVHWRNHCEDSKIFKSQVEIGQSSEIMLQIMWIITTTISSKS